jgi:hypothetical protein
MRTIWLDRILLGTALAAALVSSAWFGWKDFEPGRPRQAAGDRAHATPARYMPAQHEASWQESGPWIPPGAQTRGPGWIYEVFAPPEMFYDARANRFEVTPSEKPAEARMADESPGIELVAVKPRLFPLQLVGYVGGGEHWLGSFENALTGEIFLAGAGRQVPALNLKITDFSVHYQAGTSADNAIPNQRMATAVVSELHTGRVTVLTSDERRYSDELMAIVALNDADDETLHEVRQGDELQDSGQTYTIERLQREPPTADIIVGSADSAAPQRLTLTPRMSRAPPPSSPQN